MAFQARLFCPDRTGDKQRWTGWGIPFAQQFFLTRIISKRRDYIPFPVQCTVPKVCRIERGFFISVIAILPPKRVKALRGCVEPYGLREEARRAHVGCVKQWSNLFCCILAHGKGSLQHKSSLLKHLSLGEVFEKTVGKDTSDGK